MATDWLVYWMTLPLGLAILAAASVLPLGIWRSVLGPRCADIGIRPYIAGYLSALAGLAMLSFVSSNLDFSGRVAQGLLNESQRWTIVPGWTLYFGTILLVFVLPMLGLLGVPISAFLLNRRRLRWQEITLTLSAVWLILSCLSWAFPGNAWERTHRLDAFTASLRNYLSLVGAIALPFLLGIYATARK